MCTIRVLQTPRGYRAETPDAAVPPVVALNPCEAIGKLIESAPSRFGVKLSIEYGAVSQLPARPADDATPGQHHFALTLPLLPADADLRAAAAAFAVGGPGRDTANAVATVPHDQDRHC